MHSAPYCGHGYGLLSYGGGGRGWGGGDGGNVIMRIGTQQQLSRHLRVNIEGHKTSIKDVIDCWSFIGIYLGND